VSGYADAISLCETWSVTGQCQAKPVCDW